MTCIILIKYMPEKSGNMHATLLIGDIDVVGETEHFSVLYIIFLHLKKSYFEKSKLEPFSLWENEIKF